MTAEPVDWLEAEEILDALGIGFLADHYLLRIPGGTDRPVRIAEASPDGITVVADEFGSPSAVGARSEIFRLPFPLPMSFVPFDDGKFPELRCAWVSCRRRLRIET